MTNPQGRSIWAPLLGALSAGVPLAALAVAGFMNRALLALWSRVGGLWFAIRALLQH